MEFAKRINKPENRRKRSRELFTAHKRCLASPDKRNKL